MINLKQVYEGWRNKLIPPSEIKEQIDRVAEERTTICEKCEFVSSNMKKFKNYHTMRPDEHCTKCSCTISAKVKCLSCKCPLPQPKWNAVVSREIEKEIENEIQGT